MTLEAHIQAGFGALHAGEWADARLAFEAALAENDLPEARSGLANALWWLGDLRGTIDHLERAYAGFRQRGDPAGAAGVALMIGFYSVTHLGEPRVAEGWIQRAARLIDEHALDDLRGQLALFEGCLDRGPGAVEACARAAVEHARASGDADLELCAISLLGHARIEQGRVDEGMALLNEAMAASLGGEPDRLDTVVFTSCNMMVSCSRCAAFEQAAEWVRAAERFAERYGCPFLFAECRLVYGSVLVQTGRWPQAERELLAAIELARGSVPAYFADATAALAALRVHQGRIEEAERLVATVSESPAAAPVLARLHLIAGRSGAAAALARLHLEEREELRLDRVLLVEIAGEAEIALGDAPAAEARGRSLVQNGADRGCRVAVARGERLVGRALASGEDPAAAAHLDRARSEFHRLGMPYEAAVTTLCLAETVAPSSAPLAEAEARAALATFQNLGADRAADEALALLRTLGVRAARSGPRTDGDISDRETDVLALLGEGLSNPEIAERLFISRKTVEHHVSSLLAKLDLRNRSEAAAEAVRRGLVESGSR